MSNLGVFFCLCFLLIGGFRHFFQVRILNAVHELYVFLQHQAFREGAPGVWTVPVGKRQGNNLLAIKGLREERADYRSPQSAQRGPGGPADTSGPAEQLRKTMKPPQYEYQQFRTFKAHTHIKQETFQRTYQ